jgi:NADH dehydrogenase
MHVAVFGAGYAGVALTRKLEDRLPPEVDITVVDERDTHLVQHLVHRAIRSPGIAEELRIPFEELFDRADHRQARVERVDPDAGRAELGDGSIEYDVGAVALGARTAYYDLPGVEAHSTPLKRLAHAERIRERFLEVCEAGGRVVVGGAGLSGIQAAGELAALATEAESTAEVVLLEQADRVAPAFPERFQVAVAEELETRGIDVRTRHTVTEVDDEELAFEGRDPLAYDQLVWTGGITGGETMRGERPVVRATLRLGERTFAVGDAARVVDEDGEAVPASAQTAVREAAVAAANVDRLVEHARTGDGFEPRLDRYEYTSLGWLVSVGDGAVAQVGPSILRGRAAKTAKKTVAAGYLGQLGALERAMEYVN